VIYRKDVLAALGLKPPPKFPTDDTSWWTWDTYMSYVKQIDNNATTNALDLSGKGRMYGTVIAGSSPSPLVHVFVNMSASKGSRWFKHFPDLDPATNAWDFTPVINSPETLDALNFYIELYSHSPPEAINYVWFDLGTAFGAGNIGMMYHWTPYDYLVDKAGYETATDSKVGLNGKPNMNLYDVGLLPYQPNYPQVYDVAAWGLAISPYSEHIGAAWEFIKWATSSATQKAMGLFTPSGSQAGGAYQFTDFFRYSNYKDPDLINVYPYLPAQESTYTGWSGGPYQVITSGKVPRPCMPLYYTLEGLYGPELNKALGGSETAAQALTNVNTAWTTILSEDGYIPPPAVIPSYDDSISNIVALIQKLESGSS